jgi:protein-L-isoaspartate(D-aspartate) O-methyltransferase
MIRAMRLEPGSRVLEIGAGSGYAAALLGQIAAEVHTVERLEQLVQFARENLAAVGYENVFVHHGDGTLGWPDAAPYHAVVAAAGGPDVPPALKEQLLVGGRLVMPVGSSERRQHLICLTRETKLDYRRTSLGAVAFVPLIGKEGW